MGIWHASRLPQHWQTISEVGIFYRYYDKTSCGVSKRTPRGPCIKESPFHSRKCIPPFVHFSVTNYSISHILWITFMFGRYPYSPLQTQNICPSHKTSKITTYPGSSSKYLNTTVRSTNLQRPFSLWRFIVGSKSLRKSILSRKYVTHIANISRGYSMYALSGKAPHGCYN